ncbi:3-deoxy-D-manno-octulosonic acid transferase [Comamonas flocculans]|uniref:3-deoxy-D-manno-octulosonic acid transferase n=1 Tax=Comamonas flocculans TaxID=2597701 RepID=A0A5B8RQN5_9BURK|nr:3-deoxy-D-manno-octulosonic acid transferase [Comamonas flocculans]QEA11921.1 3-deoxy-D-manno-octulosonic acid transferase [Comamonas flocculans]
MQRIALALYSLLAWLAQPLLRRKLARRARAEPGYALALHERFGRYPDVPPARASGPRVWLHAVSLGETRAAAILLGPLRQALPGMQLLLTHGTATGRAEGVRLLRAGDLQAWLPWDTPGAVQGFLRHFHPDVGVLMETEVWPNLVAGCRRLGVPLALANARLNEKSLRGAQRLAWLARPAYAGLAAVWAQGQQDARRLASLGAPVAGVYGNLKFDAEPDAALLARGRAWRAGSARPVVLLASTREGEEALWLENIKPNRPPALAGKALAAINSLDVQWLLVPRHPQRFDEVAALCTAAGLTVSRRSAWDTAPVAADVWLGDSMGEMALYYGLADVALLGGSFAPLGGQNLIEAIACGCPLVLGPHTFNFAEAAEGAVQAGAALRVANMGAALAQARTLLQEPGAREQVLEQGSAFIAHHRGAARRTAQALAQLCGGGAADGAQILAPYRDTPAD